MSSHASASTISLTHPVSLWTRARLFICLCLDLLEFSLFKLELWSWLQLFSCDCNWVIICLWILISSTVLPFIFLLYAYVTLQSRWLSLPPPFPSISQDPDFPHLVLHLAWAGLIRPRLGLDLTCFPRFFLLIFSFLISHIKISSIDSLNWYNLSSSWRSAVTIISSSSLSSSTPNSRTLVLVLSRYSSSFSFSILTAWVSQPVYLSYPLFSPIWSSFTLILHRYRLLCCILCCAVRRFLLFHSIPFRFFFFSIYLASLSSDPFFCALFLIYEEEGKFPANSIDPIGRLTPKASKQADELTSKQAIPPLQPRIGEKKDKKRVHWLIHPIHSTAFTSNVVPFRASSCSSSSSSSIFWALPSQTNKKFNTSSTG